MPKKPRLAGVATSTSMTPSRISKSFTVAAPPSRKRHLRPRYSVALVWPSSVQRGESGGMVSDCEWAVDAKKRAMAQRARWRSVACLHRCYVLRAGKSLNRRESGADALRRAGRGYGSEAFKSNLG